MKKLKPGQVDLHQRRRYWELFERPKAVADARVHGAREAGIRFACAMLVGELKENSPRKKWAEEKAVLFDIAECTPASDAAQKYFDEQAPKALTEFMEEGRKGREVVREDENGPYKKSVYFF